MLIYCLLARKRRGRFRIFVRQNPKKKHKQTNKNNNEKAQAKVVKWAKKQILGP